MDFWSHTSKHNIRIVWLNYYIVSTYKDVYDTSINHTYMVTNTLQVPRNQLQISAFISSVNHTGEVDGNVPVGSEIRFSMYSSFYFFDYLSLNCVLQIILHTFSLFLFAFSSLLHWKTVLFLLFTILLRHPLPTMALHRSHHSNMIYY